MDSNVPPDVSAPPISGDSAAPPPPPLQPPLPPVIAPLPAPRPPSRGKGWKVFAIILIVLLGLSVLFNLQHFVGDIVNVKAPSYNGAGPRLEEVLVKDNSASGNKIAVIPIEGVISGQAMDGAGFNMVSIVKEELRRAAKDSDVKAVILKVDSPGGEVLAADEISKAIADFQDKHNKPVVVSMGSLAASGGYYVSAPCEWIVANELTITGSIGVIMHGYNYRGLLDKVGVRPEVYKSGKFKDMLSGTKSQDEISPEERQMVQSLIDETFDKFKSVVSEGRHAAFVINKKQGRELGSNWQDYADGRILSGKEAYKLGFVDELGDFETAVKRAEALARISGSRADIIQYQPIFDLSNLFRLFGKSDAKSVKLDLGVELPKLRPGCMYFIAPTYFH